MKLGVLVLLLALAACSPVTGSPSPAAELGIDAVAADATASPASADRSEVARKILDDNPRRFYGL